MKESCSEFVVSMTSRSAALQSAYLDELAYWKPEAPPMTTLFACLGSTMVESFDSTQSKLNLSLFGLIESAMQSSDQELVAAVATGTIEAMVSRWSDRPGLKDEILKAFGPTSRLHAQAWNDGQRLPLTGVERCKYLKRSLNGLNNLNLTLE